jgi:hypothetical protein
MRWLRYVYVGDNPVNYIDPTGTDFWSSVGSVIGGMFSGISGWLNGPGSSGSAIAGGASAVALGSGFLLASEGMEGAASAAAGLTGWGLIVGGGLLLTHRAYNIAKQSF